MNTTPLFNKFGQEISLHSSDGQISNSYYGFIQPLRYKNKMYLDGVNTQIGFNNQGHYLYLGPPDQDLTAIDSGGWIMCNNIKYKIDRCEKVYRGNQAFYIWAIIRTIVEIDD
ncbi:MAG TPA: hypothetical protein VFD52_06100 [Clostridia bacterium]|nr:hypothetical protein [Clostridia bacterium]